MTELAGTNTDPWCEESLATICNDLDKDCTNAGMLKETHYIPMLGSEFKHWITIALHIGFNFVESSQIKSCNQLVYLYYMKHNSRNNTPSQIEALKLFEGLHIPPDMALKVNDTESFNKLNDSITNLTDIQIDAVKTGKISTIEEAYEFSIPLQVKALKLGAPQDIALNINTTESFNELNESISKLTPIQKYVLNTDKVPTIKDASKFSNRFQLKALNFANIGIEDALSFTNEYQIAAFNLGTPSKLAIKFQYSYQVDILNYTSSLDCELLSILIALNLQENQLNKFLNKLDEYNKIINPDTQLDEFSESDSKTQKPDLFEQINGLTPKKTTISWQPISISKIFNFFNNYIDPIIDLIPYGVILVLAPTMIYDSCKYIIVKCRNIY